MEQHIIIKRYMSFDIVNELNCFNCPTLGLFGYTDINLLFDEIDTIAKLMKF